MYKEVFDLKDNEIEQYKIFVESADNNSNKRINQNNIYITIEIAIISYLSITKLDDLYLYIFCVIGIFISILWFLTIDNYSKRNKVKYQIINEYEQQKNLNWFREEEKRIGTLTNLTVLEKALPIMMFVIFIVIMILK